MTSSLVYFYGFLLHDVMVISMQPVAQLIGKNYELPIAAGRHAHVHIMPE